MNDRFVQRDHVAGANRLRARFDEFAALLLEEPIVFLASVLADDRPEGVVMDRRREAGGGDTQL